MTKTFYKPVEEKITAEPKEKEGHIRDYITDKWVKAKPEEIEAKQVFAKRLVEEYGYSKDQIQTHPEFLIQKGSKKIGPADIVIFRDTKEKTQDNLYIIVECKREEKTDGIDQLKSYLSPTNAEFGIWFNGKEIAYLQHLSKPPYFRGIPDIPKSGETLEDVGLYQKKDLTPATELKSVFEICHNYIYANEGLLKEKVFNEMLKLIFIKMADEKDPNPKCEFRITDKEEEELREGVNNGFIERIENLLEKVKGQYRDVFPNRDERINLKPLTVAFVVSQLQKYSFINTSVDVKGTAFQTFVYAHQRGERGEFFTPHPIVQLAVEMLEPKNGELFVDPACGSGGFLVRGMNEVRSQFEKGRRELNKKEIAGFVKDYAHAYIRGIDINPDLAQVAKMHMILYDDGHTGIFAANSLISFEELSEISANAGAGPLKKNSFKILTTNPPFGSKGKVTDKRILRSYELGYKWKKDKKTNQWVKTDQLQKGQVPDILFIERCLRLLADYGRMAIVLPDGDLTNSTLGYVRQFIKDNARILAVVSLLPETFIPHGAGVKASVVFLQKLPKKELEKLKKEDYPIFMAIVEKIGYDIRGREVYKRNEKGEILLDEKGEKIIDTDVGEVIEKFREFKKKNRLEFKPH